jgi:hypothetical protein
MREKMKCIWRLMFGFELHPESLFSLVSLLFHQSLKESKYARPSRKLYGGT